MRAYTAAGEEALRARNLLKDWAGEGFLTPAQYQRMEQETVCDLRRTNIFLRLVLFLFTLIIVAAAVALFFAEIVPDSARKSPSILLLLLAGLCYGGAEAAVSQARLYRYGIEEALLACSVGFLCVGIAFAVSGDLFSTLRPHGNEWLIPAAGAIASLWIWRRFGLFYAFLAAMIFAAGLAGLWSSSAPLQHLILVAIYGAGLAAIVAMRPRHRFTHLNHDYSIAEALLWLGVYLSINLQISPVNLLGSWRGDLRNVSQFAKPFYWATWVLIWCLPPLVLARGLRTKDRLVIAVGALTAVLTLATNKPYFGWQPHTWDPMLLGALLIGTALFIRRWLAQGPDGVRRGFTARRLSSQDKRWLNAGSVTIGALTPQSAPEHSEGSFFGGGDSGGGGATSDF
jgi:hypothetical protein